MITSRRIFLSGSAAAAAVGLSGATPSASAADSFSIPPLTHPGAQQNIILFMPDSLRADALSVFGNNVCKTPNYERLAKKGAAFSQCHASYPICGPSRCALLTGWPTHVRGHRSQQYFLRPEEPNLFRMLRRAGYDVYWFGKNDALAPQSFDDSVTEWNSIDGSPINMAEGGGGRGGAKQSLPLTFLNLNATPPDRRETSDYRIVESALKILARRQSSRPFCLFLAMTTPHPPYNAPAGFNDLYSDETFPEMIPADLPRRPDYMQAIRKAYGLETLSRNNFVKVRAAYYGKVTYTDWLLGELMEGLEKSTHSSNTALLTLSDHGDYTGDFGLVEKWPSGLEDCMTRVPLIAHVPGCKGGMRSNEQMQVFDVMQTCLDLAQTEAGYTHFSRSILPQMMGSSQPDMNRAAFAEGGFNVYEPQCFEPEPAVGAQYYPRLHLHHSQPETSSRSACIKTHQYTFVSRPQGQHELYVLADDPQQLHNRYGESSVRSIQDEAQRLLLEWYVNTSGIAPSDYDQRALPPFIAKPKFTNVPTQAQILDGTASA
ncbi:MAG: sulfatase-like hydrolase/transferase [Granulicella sp.]